MNVSVITLRCKLHLRRRVSTENMRTGSLRGRTTVAWFIDNSEGVIQYGKKALDVECHHIAIWFLTWRGGSPKLCHTLVLFGLSCIEVGTLFTALHCLHVTTDVCVLFFGWTSLCLRVILGLKCTGMWSLEKILLSFSDTHATYGITVCLRLFFFASPSVWFGPTVFADLIKTQFG